MVGGDAPSHKGEAARAECPLHRTSRIHPGDMNGGGEGRSTHHRHSTTVAGGQRRPPLEATRVRTGRPPRRRDTHATYLEDTWGARGLDDAATTRQIDGNRWQQQHGLGGFGNDRIRHSSHFSLLSSPLQCPLRAQRFHSALSWRSSARGGGASVSDESSPLFLFFSFSAHGHEPGHTRTRTPPSH